MSEYQYYEFQAIDRSLTPAQMARLRSFSSRARITPTSFVNEYQYSDFRGDPDKFMQHYFDAHMYLANWGTHVLMFALPTHLLSKHVASAYRAEDIFEVRERKQRLVLSFLSDDEGGFDWDDDEYQLASMIGVRSELAKGDLRALYLGWLVGVQDTDLDDDVIEPPVPPGLKRLSPCLESMADFLRIDCDLLHVASRASADSGPAAAARRTVGRLREAAAAQAEKREKREAKAEVRRKAKAELAAAIAKQARLSSMRGREQQVWIEVEELVRSLQPKSYDRAVEVLRDLKDLGGDFSQRMAAFRAAHPGKPAFHRRLREAGM
jgi:hypothetical protein